MFLKLLIMIISNMFLRHAVNPKCQGYPKTPKYRGPELVKSSQAPLTPLLLAYIFTTPMTAQQTKGFSNVTLMKLYYITISY